MKEDKVYKLYWTDKVTGKKGCSEEPDTYAVMKTWADKMNKEYPNIQHTVRNINLVPDDV